MKTIPTYALYGERPGAFPLEGLHCESIAERSRLHQWEIRPHRHEAFFQILYIAAGTAEMQLEGGRLVPRPPCVITVPALAMHGFVFSRQVRGLVVTAVDKQLEALLAQVPQLYPQLAAPRVLELARSSPQATRMQRLFADIAGEFAGTAAWRREAIRASLALVLMHVARDAAAVAPGIADAPQPRMRHVARFRALIDRWYREHRPVADYAAQLGITPTQLNRVCRAVLATSALGAIHRRLMLEAGRDLVYTSIGVKQIARALGFRDEAYFSRFFARHAGRTPSAFRTAAHRRLAR